ncbi:MAG: methyltransferase domain-containing protein [Gammaproteobacteria bacterium]|nr:methyltransferase domain-containing protein [Gammaproteobacteria bacterium]
METTSVTEQWMVARQLIVQKEFKQAYEILNILSAKYKHPELWVDLIKVAIKEKKFDDAADWIARLQSFYPNDVRGFGLKANLCYCLGYYNEALQLYRELILISPNDIGYLVSMAYTHCMLRQFDEAIYFFKQSEIFLKEYPAVWLRNYATALLFSKDIQSAIKYFEKIDCTQYPDSQHDPEFWFHFGLAYDQAGQNTKALSCYQLAIKIDRNHIQSLYNMSVIYGRQKKRQEALSCLNQILTFQPDHILAKTLYDIYSAQELPKLPLIFIQTLFDQYSFNYEAHLKKELDYQAPAIARSVLVRHAPNLTAGVLYDLGAGTGAMGLVMQDLASKLIAVDCSEGMLQQARQRGLYHEYIVDDVMHWAASALWNADFITMIELSNYLGADLNELLDLAINALNPGGWLVLTAEELRVIDCEKPFQMTEHARYAYQESFFKNFFNNHINVSKYAIERHPLRMHDGQEEIGLYCVVQKKIK